jgi:PAS domain-containing protein
MVPCPGAVSDPSNNIFLRETIQDINRESGWSCYEDKMRWARSEQEFQNVLRRLELALDASQIGVWEHNTGTDEVLWDPQMHRLYAIDTTHGKITPAQWVSALHPDDRTKADRTSKKLFNARGTTFPNSGLFFQTGISATSGRGPIITRMAITGHLSVQNGMLPQMCC